LALAACAACANRFSPTSSKGPDSDGFGDGAGGALVQPALLSAVPGVSSLRLEWGRPEEGAVFGLFVGTDESTLFDGPPALLEPEGEAAVLFGLPTDTVHFAGLARQIDGIWISQGPRLLTRTGLVIFVDPQGGGSGSDGSTPDTAFGSLFLGVLKAFSLGGGNVWVARGQLTDVSVSILDGVDVYGGFPAGFDLAARDTAEHRTTLVGTPGEDVLRIALGVECRVLDGFSIEGQGTARNAVDVDGVPAQLRRISTARCNRGFKLRAVDETLEMVVVGCSAFDHAVEGLSGAGPLELRMDACTFTDCGQEGLDLDDLVALDGDRAKLRLQGSSFLRNGQEGVDVDLSAPILGGSQGGRLEVRIENCEFADNGLDGLLVDIEFELFPLWSAEVILVGCLSRNNGAAGLRLDLDARADVLVHRFESVANGGPGIAIGAESHQGLVTVSSSSLVGNHGQGILALQGQFILLVGHCVFSGNAGGGVTAFPLDAVAVSSVARLQDTPWTNVLPHFSIEAGVADLPLFENAPTQWLEVTARQGTTLTVAVPPTFAAGVPCELDGDGVSREALVVTATSIELETVPAALGLPATLAAFPVGGDVDEDHTLVPASIARDAGMPTPAGAPVDAGPLGGPFGGEPGSIESGARPRFFLTLVRPAAGVSVGPDQDVELEFAGGTPDPASLTNGVSAVDPGGSPVAATFAVVGDFLVASPPPGGWPQGTRIQLHRGLVSAGGGPLGVESAWLLAVQ
ncbi:MAG: right-handed parallel beta-helix repeat-containing protein, partial [Planctomycetota bacterium]